MEWHNLTRQNCPTYDRTVICLFGDSTFIAKVLEYNSLEFRFKKVMCINPTELSWFQVKEWKWAYLDDWTEPVNDKQLEAEMKQTLDRVPQSLVANGNIMLHKVISYMFDEITKLKERND